MTENKGALPVREVKNESWGSSVTTKYKLSNPLCPSRFILSLKCGGTMETCPHTLGGSCCDGPHDGMSLVGWSIHVGNCLVDQVGKSKDIKE
jgi:hypothetical protein